MKIARLSQTPKEGLSHDPEIEKQVLLANGQVPGLTNVSVSTLKSGQRTSAHSHLDMYELFYVSSGQGEILIDDERRKISPGTLVVVEPNENHRISNTGEADLVLFYFGVE